MSEQMYKIAMLFPGQGAQYVGMGKAFYNKYTEVRRLYEEAGHILKFDIGKLCFEGNETELAKTENVQPAILTVSYAAYQVYLKEHGIDPLYFIGHSLGEYTALVASKAIRFSDALQIVRRRGQLMQEAVAAGDGAMVAIQGLESAIVEEQCRNESTDEQLVTVSNYNGPHQLVISGKKQAVSKVVDNLVGLGGKAYPLKVSAPFHSPLMMPAAERLKEELQKYSFENPKCLVISNVTGKPYSYNNLIDNLYNQMFKPVNWFKSMEYVRRKGIDLAIDIGPNTIQKNMICTILPDVDGFNYENEDDVSRLIDKFASVSFDGHLTAEAKIKFINSCLSYMAGTKNRNPDEVIFAEEVANPYQRFANFVIEWEQSQINPTIQNVKDAFALLRRVLQVKMVPLETQKEIYTRIWNESKTHHLFTDVVKELREIESKA